ncbi:MAG: hypothetical protein AB9915_00315 [Candidatus Dojkabacteria bacterium]
MSFGKIVVILGGGILLALIGGLVTRNLFVAFAFPFLLFAFYIIWKSFKKDLEVGNIHIEEKEEVKENDQKVEEVVPTVKEELSSKNNEPVSTYNPPSEV